MGCFYNEYEYIAEQLNVTRHTRVNEAGHRQYRTLLDYTSLILLLKKV